MKTIADQLPPEIAQHIHPDRRKNEAGYWAVRDQLLDKYRGQWIGFADGRVVASGTSPVTVFEAAEATGLYPFFSRATFPYDAGYPGEALPVISVEFRQARGLPGGVLGRVIPDTGADASVLPWAANGRESNTKSACYYSGLKEPHGTVSDASQKRRDPPTLLRSVANQMCPSFGPG